MIEQIDQMMSITKYLGWNFGFLSHPIFFLVSLLFLLLEGEALDCSV